MISASEPLEFIPRGRKAVEEHPGPLLTKQQSNVPNDHLLLHRLQNVNISSDEDGNEFWTIRSLYEDLKKNNSDNSGYTINFFVNNEEELYAKGHTAVWSKGLDYDDNVLPRTCFTTDTPIKFAFFCNKNFLAAKVSKSSTKEVYDSNVTGICIIDSNSLKVYQNDGENYLANLEFPVSNIWQTEFGIILEKAASSITIQTHLIPMPRFFLLTHPLDEMCPLLIKSNLGVVTYLIESDYNIIFSAENSDLLLMYDNKFGKHFVAKLRKATEIEINFVSGGNESNVTSFHTFNRPSGYNFSQNSLKISNIAKNSTLHMAKSSFSSITPQSAQNFKFDSVPASPQPINFTNSHTSRSIINSPLIRLQSSLGAQSISVQDIRKIGQTEPSKPIVPEFCLDYIWTENITNREFCEAASIGFMHTDLIEQKYICYLLPRLGKLNLVRIEKTNNLNNLIFGITSTISAKDCVVLEKMKMIAVLGQCSTLMLYTGAILIAKVHLNGIPSTPNVTNTFSPFPRRSSLLPTVQQPLDTQFEDELHMLSPVHPLQPNFTHRNLNSLCTSLRDPACNRLTLVYSSGKMFRIALPLLNETPFITRCLNAVRQVLKKDLYIQLIIKWYGARNAPGSLDFSCRQEWETFKNVLSELIGRAVSSNESSLQTSLEEPKKRKKGEDLIGNNSDWEYMNKFLSTNNNGIEKSKNILHSDTTAPLFPHIPAIFYSLHLLYEDIKLDIDMIYNLKYLAEFLFQMATDLQLESYRFHYFLDYPRVLNNDEKNFFTLDNISKLNSKNLISKTVPNIYQHIVDIIKGKEVMLYPYILNVNTMSKNIIKLTSLICYGPDKIKTWFQNVLIPGTPSSEQLTQKVRKISKSSSPIQLIEMLLDMDFNRNDIDRLPPGISFIIAHSLEYSRLSPPTGCSRRAYELLLRHDLVSHATFSETSKNYTSNVCSNLKHENSLSPRINQTPNIVSTSETSLSENDGMENIDTKLFRLRFPDDLRLMEVRGMLISSEPVIIDIKQLPGVSDHDFIEEQEKQLYALCIRTMILPMGRGMLTLRTLTPTATESFPVPKLCLTGKEPIKGATIEMQQIEFPPNMSAWPSFHNGVAAGLRITPEAKDVDSTWIIYNKPKGPTENSCEHAGFLMALGLNGHLKTLSFMSIYEYLVKCDEMTSAGLLLGISATHRGTMDSKTTKLLSVHIESLLPATALELDIPQNIQVSSLMGIGLVYQGSAKRHIAEILLQEIGRPPGPEMENSLDRESYALAAGLSLGLVTLGQGESPAGLRDLQLPDTLHYYMVGGNKRPLIGSQKEKYKLPSFQVREGKTVNIDVTAPGATLALGLMFFNTGNSAVAEWMEPPNTNYLLELIRPDLLLLRVIAKGLILWNDIQPTSKWLFGQFPSSLEFDLKRGPPDNETDIDHEANAQSYCNIIAGAAFCLGLRYAGTNNEEAIKTLKKTTDLFLSIGGFYVGEYAGKTTIESSLILTLISLSLVTAGTGNLYVLRVVRYLRSRIGSLYSYVTYGSHMALHMALGFQFLGAGRYTLSRTPESIAALVCALFPKFPNHSTDNRYHLQALRHLYVLAVEPRLFLPRDIDSGKLCLCHITYIEIGSEEIKTLTMAPCMLPELNSLQAIIINDPNYWPVYFERNLNWTQLKNVLKNCGTIDIKKRAGCLSHTEDPNRMKSLLAQTLTAEKYSSWKIDPKSLLTYSSDSRVLEFIEKFLNFTKKNNNYTENELEKTQLLLISFYNCITKDKMHALPLYSSIINLLDKVSDTPNAYDIWQFKILEAFVERIDDDIFLSQEIVSLCIQKLKNIIELWQNNHLQLLKQFISVKEFQVFANVSIENLKQFIAVIVFDEFASNLFNFYDSSNNGNFLKNLCNL